MPKKALFGGLIRDEFDNPVEVAQVGEEPCYVVNDNGFLCHIPSEQVDRQVLDQMREMIEGHEDTIGKQTAKMLGMEDIFSVAMLRNQLKNIDKQFEALLEMGIPEEARAFLGMSGFKVTIDIHGEVLRIDQAGAPGPDGSGEE